MRISAETGTSGSCSAPASRFLQRFAGRQPFLLGLRERVARTSARALASAAAFAGSPRKARGSRERRIELLDLAGEPGDLGFGRVICCRSGCERRSALLRASRRARLGVRSGLAARAGCPLRSDEHAAPVVVEIAVERRAPCRRRPARAGRRRRRADGGRARPGSPRRDSR